MRRHALSIALLSASWMMASCGAQSLDAVLKDQRSTAKYAVSKAAFKEIMRHYVHGENEPVTDEELDREFEQYITLTKDQVTEVIDKQSCVPVAGAAEAQYYLVNVAHQRHDAFFAPTQHLPITGTGTQSAHATFSANNLLERQTIKASTPMPSRATQPGAPFPTWDSIRTAMTDQATFAKTFKLNEDAQRQQIFARTSGMDWAQSVSGEVFMSPALAGGEVFSPALFAVYLFRADPSASFSVFMVVSADAAGRPQSSYVGLIDSERKDYKSVTGFSFTYLSSANNLLNYAVVTTGSAPLTFELWITTAYPDHADSPYLTVHATFAPAYSEKVVAHYRDVPGAKIVMMLRKGALMRDLIKLYFPGSSSVQLWNDVGALTHDQGFRDKLAALGLDLAADLFESKLWLERPAVTSGGSNTFAVQSAMTVKCDPTN